MKSAPPLLPVPGLYERTTPAFRRKLAQIGERLGMDPNHIAAVMSSESGFRPESRNKDTRATGLIGFMPATAKLLGTTVDELFVMTAERQLDYVEAYYMRFPWHAKLRTATQVYMATFTGEAFHEPSYVVFEYPSIGYRQNKVFDRNGDGRITVAEVGSFVEERLAMARRKLAQEGPPKVEEEPRATARIWPVVLLAGLGALAARRMYAAA